MEIISWLQILRSKNIQAVAKKELHEYVADNENQVVLVVKGWSFSTSSIPGPDFVTKNKCLRKIVDLALQFEAVSHMPEDERRIIKALLDGMIMKYQTRKMVNNLSNQERMNP